MVDVFVSYARTDTAIEAPSEGAEPAWVGAVLDFWFRELGEDLWFASGRELDERIRSRFLTLHERLLSDAHEVAGARPLLAAIIVLDQFSRNMFRGTPRAFAADDMARRLAQRVIDGGLDAAMPVRERYFVHLPFEHSEDRDDQALSVRLTEPLGNQQWTSFARAHRRIIDRFGRFPHRNAILGRTSTAEELEVLKQPMSSF
jgi:uncharacterized protein (DUF924 family)